MANNGSFAGNAVAPGGYGGNYYWFNWSLQSQNVTTNTSTIAWACGWHFQNADHQLDNGSCSVNGGLVYSNTGRVYNYTGNFTTRDMTIASGSATVVHNADGTKVFSASGGMSAYSGYRSDGSGSWQLPTIPRASTPTFTPSPVEAGQTVTINTNRATTSFTHALSWQIGSLSATIGTGIGASTTWAVPIGVAEEIKTSSTGTIQVLCITYSGSTEIGRKTVSLPVSVPNTPEYQPTILDKQVSEATEGLFEKIGAYVQNKSKLALSMNAQGVHGSTIQSYEISVVAGGDVQKFLVSSTVTDPIASSGVITIQFKATDSRQRSVTETQTIDVLPYASPYVQDVTVKRADANGVLDEQGTYGKVFFTAAITPLNSNNDKSYKVRYKLRSASQWTETVVPNPQYEMNDVYILESGISTVSAYDFELIATDFFSASTGSDVLPISYKIMSVANSGMGAAFGTTATEDLLEIAMPIKVSNPEAQEYFSIDVPAGSAGRSLWEIICDRLYPVGSIYMSVSASNPAAFFGGTWVAWGAGRVPVGVDTADTDFNAVEKTGGAKKISHTHNVPYAAGINSSKPQILSMNAISRFAAWIGGGFGVEISANGSSWVGDTVSGNTELRYYYTANKELGNVQPYVTCYMWKRTA